MNRFQGGRDQRVEAPWRMKTMHWSIYNADRGTHLKIVVVGLAAALLMAVIGISATELNLGTDIMSAQAPTVVKAGGPIMFTNRGGPTIR
jgi:hypothetical protein